MAGIRKETFTLKPFTIDTASQYHVAGETMIYALSGALYAINENNTRFLIASISGSQGVSALSSLTDVTITSPVSGQSLVYNGSKWINSTISGSGGGATALSNLTDVTVTSPVSGQGLIYNGSKWINATTDVPLTFSVSTYPYLVDLAFVPVKYIPCTITGVIKSWEVISENAGVGNVDIDVWYNTATLPTSADSIAIGNHPRLVGENQHKDMTLTGWSKNINNGYFGVQAQSISGLSGFTVQIIIAKA